MRKSYKYCGSQLYRITALSRRNESPFLRYEYHLDYCKIRFRICQKNHPHV